MPVATLDVKGIMIIVKKDGITISNLLQSILLICIAIIEPTIIRAGAVISVVITARMGEKNKAIAKQAAIITDVKPVLPPTAIPAEDSTLVAGVDVPSIDSVSLAIESSSIALPVFVMVLFFMNPGWLESTIKAPAVSKKATNKNVKITVMSSVVK